MMHGIHSLGGVITLKFNCKPCHCKNPPHNPPPHPSFAVLLSSGKVPGNSFVVVRQLICPAVVFVLPSQFVLCCNSHNAF